jgi:phage gp36-like protein
MAYCNQSDIEAEIQPSDLIGLTDDSNTGFINTTILDSIIANASSYIDGKIGNIYATPVSPIPAIVKDCCIRIACYRLYRRRLAPGEKNNFDNDFKDAMTTLNMINNGEYHLDLDPKRAFPQGAVVREPMSVNASSL